MPVSSLLRPERLPIGLFCIIFHAEHDKTTLNPSNPSKTPSKMKVPHVRQATLRPPKQILLSTLGACSRSRTLPAGIFDRFKAVGDKT